MSKETTRIMDECAIGFAELVDYHDERADEATAARVGAHLFAGCPACTRRLAWLRRALGALRASGDLQHAPVPALARARALFRERSPAPARPSILARLVFDSRATLSPALARGGDEETSVQLLFRTEEHDIDLWQERRNSRSWYLIGQVLPRSEEDAAPLVPQSAVLTAADGAEIAAVPEGGEFHLPDVPPGRYRLRLGLTENDVLVPDLDVGR